jgi:uncharacterized membrane protein YdjX (TVP38/TMEM64 family)
MTQPMVENSQTQSPAKPHRVRRFLRQTGPAGPVALVATVMPIVGAGVLAGFGPRLVPWLQSHGWAGVVLFVISFSVLGGFALVPTYANSMLGGWTFKFTIGYPAVMAGLTGAAAVGYFLAHRIVGHRVSNVIHEHPRWQVVRDALIGGSAARVIGVIAILRLSPILPFETSNVLLASCEVKLLPYLIGTFIGVMPRTAALVFIASRAHKLEMSSPGQRWMIVASVVATVAVIVLLAVISKHALRACGVAPEGACDVNAGPNLKN